jgi:hypothetical protein
MKKKAHAEGLPLKMFNEMWMQCFQKAVREQQEVGNVEGRNGKVDNGGVAMEVVQYEAEKGLWERRCKRTCRLNSDGD